MRSLTGLTVHRLFVGDVACTFLEAGFAEEVLLSVCIRVFVCICVCLRMCLGMCVWLVHILA